MEYNSNTFVIISIYTPWSFIHYYNLAVVAVTPQGLVILISLKKTQSVVYKFNMVV